MPVARLIEFTCHDRQVPVLDETYKLFHGPDLRCNSEAIWSAKAVDKTLEIEAKYYDRIVVKDAEGKVHYYYVNFDDAQLAVPVLEGLIAAQNRELGEKVEQLKREKNRLQRIIAHLKEVHGMATTIFNTEAI